jgi:hypothetical protein
MVTQRSGRSCRADPRQGAARALRTWIEQRAPPTTASAKAFAAEARQRREAAVRGRGHGEPRRECDSDARRHPQLALHTPIGQDVSSLARAARAASARAACSSCCSTTDCSAWRDARALRDRPSDSPRTAASCFRGRTRPTRYGRAHDVRTGRYCDLRQRTRRALAAAVHKAAGLVALGGSAARARLSHRTASKCSRARDIRLSVAFAPDGRWVAAGDTCRTRRCGESGRSRVPDTADTKALCRSRSSRRRRSADRGRRGTVRRDVAKPRNAAPEPRIEPAGARGQLRPGGGRELRATA